MKYYLSFLIILFAFVGLVSSSKDKISSPLKIAQVSGILHEKKGDQDIMLVVEGKKINPSLFKQLVLKEEELSEIYFSKLICDYKKETEDYSYIKCLIDLSKIPKGFYKIAFFLYDNEKYKNSKIPPILYSEMKKRKN